MHLKAIKTPTLIVQGERDALGNKEDVAGYTLSKKIQFHWLSDGDHSFKPVKISGQSQEGNWNDAIRIVAEFARFCRRRMTWTTFLGGAVHQTRNRQSEAEWLDRSRER